MMQVPKNYHCEDNKNEEETDGSDSEDFRGKENKSKSSK